MKYIGSYHQERIWFIDTFERGSLYDNGPVYHNIPLILYIKDGLDSEIVRRTLDFLTEKNEILRTGIITIDNVVYQEVSEAGNIPLQIVDKCKESMTKKEALDYLVNINNETFRDGIAGILCKATLLQVNGFENYLLITLHHSICDDVSKQIIKQQFITVYEQIEQGEEPNLSCDDSESEIDDIMREFFAMSEEENQEKPSAESLSYKEYAKMQKDLPDEVIENEVMYWKEHLKEQIQALEIATDEKRAAVHIYEPAVEVRELPIDFTNELSLFQNRYGVESWNFFLGAFKILFMKYSQLQEINIGTSISDNRIPEVKDTLGPISNLVLLSDELSDAQSFLDIAEQVKKTYEGAKEHSVIPFDKLVMEINPENDMSRTALFDVLYNYTANEEGIGERFEEFDYNLGWGKYDYNLLVKENEEGIRFIMTYNKLYFRECSIERLLHNLETLCRWIFAHPKDSIQQADYISKEEKELQLVEWNKTEVEETTNLCIHQLFEEQVKKNKNRIALQDEDRQITYDELNKKANQVANYLAKKNIQHDDKVAIILEKDIECIAIILGILKVGGAYVPIDKYLPKERVKFMLKDCKAKCCITKEEYKEVADDYESLVLCGDMMAACSQESTEFESDYKTDSLAYIIYTSGTTGKPKGVLLEHQNVTRLVKNNAFLFNFTEEDVWTMFHSYNFDFSVWEMYGCLLNGGKLVLISKDSAMDTKKFYEILVNNKVTILNQTPSAFYALEKEECGHEEKNMAVRKIIFGGEALNTAKLADWRERYPKVEFINMYGITETTIHVTFKKITDEIIEKGENTIGKPLPTYKGYVMDQNQQIVPIGVKGEFVVGGSGVCRGYLNLPEMTEQKFIENPYQKGERLYRSGDLVRMKYNGELEYLGRIDKQVQIRGFRIEIGEIETVLLKHDDIEAACIVPRDNGIGSLELVGYLIIKEGRKLNHNSLSGYLKGFLPEYMVPSKFIKVDSIPITGNGKVDTTKLLKTKGGSLDAGSEYMEATTELEKQLVEIWRKTIDAEKIGIYDNYFHLGGNSLLVTKLMFLINETYHIEIPYKYFFTKPTIKDLADYLIQNEAGVKFSIDDGIDWEEEMQYELEISEDVPYAKNKDVILLTGATGFLGGFLLKSLLEKTNAKIYCLVRAKDSEQAMERLILNLSYFHINVGDKINRVNAILGDLEKEKLGMSEEVYKEMSEKIDVIYHNGAIAMYGYSYKQLKAANVQGTAEIIKLAALNKRKTIHYVSTISVFDGTTKTSLIEDDIPDYGNMSNQSGYGMSKLVAEALLRRAREKGIKINIYRSGRIAGSSVDGACQSKDFLWMLIMACIEVNAFMGQTVPAQMVPVDILADAMIDISQKDKECNHNFHLNKEQPITGEKIKEWLCDCGYFVSMDEYQQWYQKVAQKAKRSYDSVCAKIMPMLSADISEEVLSVTLDESNVKKFYDVDTKFYIENIEEIFKNTIKFFQEKGIIEFPGGA